jgi:UDP-N-acetylmuramoyl-tripeptide--D-alanyl-D-alanine ligase
MKLLDAFLEVKKVSTDSRNDLKDSIFFALKGANFNGNTFAAEALAKGARYVVIDEHQPALPEDKCFVVDDALTALQELATAYRKTFTGTVIGLTGSNGKTTCKELFRDVLATTYKTSATEGNLNNHIGVPLTLLHTPADAEMIIIEMGANHQREIALLSSICEPDLGFITNYGKAHLEGFGGVEGVIKGKSELYDYLRAHQKTALVNCKDAKQLEKSSGIARVTFGNCNEADICIENELGTMATARFEGEHIASQLTGDFHFNNIAAAIALGSYFKVKPSAIKVAIEAYNPSMNRSEWKKTERNEVLLDAYNANPDSMQASVIAFTKIEKPNKWFVLGDMFELGEYTHEEHQRIVNMLEDAQAKNVLLIGDAFAQTTKPANYYCVRETPLAKELLHKLALDGCTILLKGSRGMRLETLLDAL